MLHENKLMSKNKNVTVAPPKFFSRFSPPIFFLILAQIHALYDADRSSAALRVSSTQFRVSSARFFVFGGRIWSPPLSPKYPTSSRLPAHRRLYVSDWVQKCVSTRPTRDLRRQAWCSRQRKCVGCGQGVHVPYPLEPFEPPPPPFILCINYVPKL